MKYCKKCVLPDTRPGLVIEKDGVCSGCKQHEMKVNDQINWKQREKELLEILATAKSKKSEYDCIVPVSGGKDSTWQVIKCLEYGLKVLAVTWRTLGRTEIGQKNLDNLINLGVDHIDFTINPELESKFMRKTFLATGSTAVPMHLALYTTPLRFAVKFNIPLVIWGESPFMEYAKDTGDTELNQLNHNWLKKHGILQGSTARDWVDGKEITQRDISPYEMPSEKEFNEKGIKSIFLGYYLPWDPEETKRVSVANGFSVRDEGPKLGIYNYADIDCDFISVHHWFKWHKFGFTRAFDNISLEIRNNRMTREEGLELLKKLGNQKPVEDIKKICKFMNISLDEFEAVEDKYRNKSIWYKEDGIWKIKDFIIDDWVW